MLLDVRRQRPRGWEAGDGLAPHSPAPAHPVRQVGSLPNAKKCLSLIRTCTRLRGRLGALHGDAPIHTVPYTP